MDVSAIPITQLIPHRQSMCLVDRVLAFADKTIVAEFTVDASNIFVVDEGYVPVWVGLEYMAQTIAAYTGLNHYLNHEPIKLGFLLGTRRLETQVEGFFPQSTYWVSATEIYEDNGLSVFESILYQAQDGVNPCTEKLKDNEWLVRASVNAFQPDDPSQMLQQSVL
ncbi:ApeP family dehydratase [Zooshikella harenae]|uniref:3-hydroxylacyl-ACP dehydratase n=1 Tax=Zooshikella harenae TaxID=2827238 RepID=A0ABS5ZB38_9GAMM|nr:hypothetical protein [Zooshikella harenae]MBU2711266.1 hypothetical protein [Zooshikella harenae]